MEELENENRDLRLRVSNLIKKADDTAAEQAEKDRLQSEYEKSQLRFRTIFEESSVGKKIIDDQLRIF